MDFESSVSKSAVASKLSAPKPAPNNPQPLASSSTSSFSSSSSSHMKSSQLDEAEIASRNMEEYREKIDQLAQYNSRNEVDMSLLDPCNPLYTPTYLLPAL